MQRRNKTARERERENRVCLFFLNLEHLCLITVASLVLVKSTYMFVVYETPSLIVTVTVLHACQVRGVNEMH